MNHDTFKIYDMHIHSEAALSRINSERILERMETAGVYGGCIFSERPHEGVTFEERLEGVMTWTKGYEDRLFPVMYIHPDEEDILQKIHIAAEWGVCAFKIICRDFYVYEEKSMKVLREIAKMGKPVFFHSGILWDGKVSSNYNRPLNWEALLEIEGLRFSMGHCSWPWIDECVALYGKFMNALSKGNSAEMFFDITPGTPVIYREELLTKIYTVGYDVGDNIMFGTDGHAEDYKNQWTAKWLKIDGEILDKIGVSEKNRRKLYHDNLMRFLGKTPTKIEHAVPDIDDSREWSPR